MRAAHVGNRTRSCRAGGSAQRTRLERMRAPHRMRARASSAKDCAAVTQDVRICMCVLRCRCPLVFSFASRGALRDSKLLGCRNCPLNGALAMTFARMGAFARGGAAALARHHGSHSVYWKHTVYTTVHHRFSRKNVLQMRLWGAVDIYVQTVQTGTNRCTDC